MDSLVGVAMIASRGEDHPLLHVDHPASPPSDFDDFDFEEGSDQQREAEAMKIFLKRARTVG